MECGTGKREEIQSNFTVDKPANTILGYHYHESQGHLQHAMEMAHHLCVFCCQIPNVVFSSRKYQTRASKVAPGKKTTPSLTTEFNPGTHMVGGKKLTPWAGEIAHV